ncbi:MAG: acyl-CoA carboxylase subunit beta [Bacteroidetes bacterium]|nr:acyl-CoA carboxylase subunit beta [Bacteroidota bacterium]
MLKKEDGLTAEQDLLKKQQQALRGGGEKRIEAQHKKGKYTARERIEKLVDANSFQEFDMFKMHNCNDFGMDKDKYPGDGVVTGSAKIDGRTLFVYAQDFTVVGGSLSKTHAEKICKVMDMAVKAGVPVIGLNDSGGARIQEGIDALAGYGEIFYRNVMASGVIPQITAILGPCAGGAVYSPAIQDFIIMTRKNSYMFITGPKVVKEIIHEDVSVDTLGGAAVHTEKSGVSHFVAEDEEEALQTIRTLLSYMPQNNRSLPPYYKSSDISDRLCPELQTIMPDSVKKPYDVKNVIKSIVDDGIFFETAKDFGKSIVTGFCRMNGFSVGVIANQPMYMAGVLDIDSSVKAGRFVRMCDSFNIPLLTLEDVPGFMPGTQQEHNGIIRHGAKLLYAYAEATVPKVTIIMRKAYGGAYIVMNSRHLRADYVYAWPEAEIAVMGAKGAAEIVFRRESSKAKDVDKFMQEKEVEYQKEFSHPYRAAEKGYIDAVIDPAETRKIIIRSFETLVNKQETLPYKKHGNIPL